MLARPRRLGLDGPLVGVTVAVEDDALVLVERLLACRRWRRTRTPRRTCPPWRRRIPSSVLATAVLSTMFAVGTGSAAEPRHAELELVAREGEGARCGCGRCCPCWRFGSTGTPRSTCHPCRMDVYALPSTIASTMALSSSPRKMETIAGGASLAPRRWSLPQRRPRSCAAAPGNRRRPAMTPVRNTRNCRLSMRGLARIEQVLVLPAEMDQLLCLPEPLMPSNGFSC